MRSLGGNRFIVDTYLLDHNGRRVRICFYSFRVDHRDTLDGREPKLSVTTSPSGRIAAAATLARHHAVCSTVSNRRDRGNRSVGKLVELFFTRCERYLCGNSATGCFGRLPEFGRQHHQANHCA